MVAINPATTTTPVEVTKPEENKETATAPVVETVVTESQPDTVEVSNEAAFHGALNNDDMSEILAPEDYEAPVSDPVDNLYKNVLGRDADEGGKAYWTEQMANGMTIEEVEANFRASEEFKNKPVVDEQSTDSNNAVAETTSSDNQLDTTSSLDSSGEETSLEKPFDTQVEALYEDVLGRASDGEGKAFWIQKMEEGMSFEEMEAHFRASEEFANKPIAEEIISEDQNISVGSPNPVTPEDKVEQLYADLLGREADAEGKAYWTEQLKNGATLEDVKEALKNSSEYTDADASLLALTLTPIVVAGKPPIDVAVHESSTTPISASEQQEINQVLNNLPSELLTYLQNEGVSISVLTGDVTANDLLPGALAIYDPYKKELIVPHDALSVEALGSTIVHEMGHSFDNALDQTNDDKWHSLHPEWQQLLLDNKDWALNPTLGLPPVAGDAGNPNTFYMEGFARAFNDYFLEDELRANNPNHPPLPPAIKSYMENLLARNANVPALPVKGATGFEAADAASLMDQTPITVPPNPSSSNWPPEVL